MFVDSDATGGGGGGGGGRGSPPRSNPKTLNLESPPHKPHLFDSSAVASSSSAPKFAAAAVPQELTFSYLCDNPKLALHEREGLGGGVGGGDLLSSRLTKGKEVAASADDDAHQQQRWVERDFLQLAGGKREAPDGPEAADGREKKVKIETLNLSLAPPSLSLSLNSSVPAATNEAATVAAASAPAAAAAAAVLSAPAPHLVPPKKSYSNNTRMTNSEDYGASLSYSCSVFSHNPSCSLTRNSTENYQFSRGENDQMWYAGEGTNGSVHSRFKPVGDGNTIAFANHNSKELNSGFYRTNSSDNVSFLPSELPAKPMKGNPVMSSEGGRNLTTRVDKLLKEIVSESIPAVADILNDIHNDSLEAVRECLKKLMEAPEKKDEFASLVRRLERRSDLTLETLSKAHRTQLEILVSIKTGLVSYVSGKSRVPANELAEIFVYMRCKNIECKSPLPVDDCDCKICSTKKGFCSNCMCPVCLKFDCALNTCSWVGCDVCSHWCHAVCGIEKNLIRPGASLKGPMGMTEMQFQCLGCGHASEMFGFVKEVFNICAKDWGHDTLMKELDCVRNIFRASEDFEGKGLHAKAEEVLNMLSRKLISPKDACANMLQFFKYGVTEFSVTGSSSKGILAQASQHQDILPLSSTAAITAPKPAISFKPTTMLNNPISSLKPDPKPPALEAHFSQPKDGGFQSLETMVKFKEAEAKLFERLADEARKEVEGYRQIVRAKSEKLDEEYTTKIAKLCLQETEEKRRKKLEELKFLENSHYDYHNMKMRMQAEIAGLLERMEATKKLWA